MNYDVHYITIKSYICTSNDSISFVLKVKFKMQKILVFIILINNWSTNMNSISDFRFHTISNQSLLTSSRVKSSDKLKFDLGVNKFAHKRGCRLRSNPISHLSFTPTPSCSLPLSTAHTKEKTTLGRRWRWQRGGDGCWRWHVAEERDEFNLDLVMDRIGAGWEWDKLRNRWPTKEANFNNKRQLCNELITFSTPCSITRVGRIIFFYLT